MFLCMCLLGHALAVLFVVLGFVVGLFGCSLLCSIGDDVLFVHCVCCVFVRFVWLCVCMFDWLCVS